MFNVENLKEELKEVLLQGKAEINVNSIFDNETEMIEDILDDVLNIQDISRYYFETADHISTNKISEEDAFAHRLDLEYYICEILYEMDGQVEYKDGISGISKVFTDAAFRHLISQLHRNTNLILTHYVLSKVLEELDTMDDSKEFDVEDYENANEFVDYIVCEITDLLAKNSYEDTYKLGGLEEEYLELLNNCEEE